MQTVNQMEADLLREKLDKLKKNEASISKEELITKYKKSYKALLDDINSLANRVMGQELFYFLYPKSFLERGRQLVLEQFERNKIAIANALYKHYSVDEYVKILRKMNSDILDDFFSAGYTMDNEIGKSINPWIIPSAATA